MTGLFHDLSYAIRQLRKSPGFTVVAVITLALGIGANTAVFSMMDAVLLRSLPVRDPARLYYLRMAKGVRTPPGAGNTGDPNVTVSEPVFEALRQRRDVFDDLIAYVPLGIGKVAVRYGTTPEEAEGDEVSGNFFSGISAQLLNGRGFSTDDEKNHAPVAVISYDYWTRRFARDPAALGATLYVKSVPFTVVGIAARGFRGIEPASSTDFWIPLQSRPELNAWGIPAELQSMYGTPRWWCLMLIGRLRPGISPDQAQQALRSTFGEAAKTGIGTIDPGRWKPLLAFDPAIGIKGYNRRYREQMHILMGLVLLVLLIACVNVALLLMARNEARQREFSLRFAMGATKSRLLGQLFTESLLLVIAGAGLGWVFCLFATDVLAVWSGIESGLSPNRTVLLFTLGISVFSALVFGLAPWWVAQRHPLAAVMRAAASNLTPDRRRALGGRIIMSLQVAVCLLLLVAAGLLLRTLRNYQSQDLGLRTDGLLVFGVNPQSAHSAQEVGAFFHTVLDRLGALPGVESATLMGNRPGTNWSDNNDFRLDGRLSQKAVRSNNVGPACFHVLGVPILRGRDIAEYDTPASTPVAVVNETFVKQFLPNTNPIGHQLDNKTIVGVVKDNKYAGVDETPMPMAYYPVFQRMFPGFSLHVVVRVHGEPLNLVPSIRRAMSEIDSNVPLEKPTTLQAQFEESYAQPAMFGRLAGFFGGLGALLVATGLYGTLAYRTNRRTAEIGTRMALGAQRGQVLWMVMRESLLIGCLGTIVGFPLALYCARFLSSMLYQMSPFDAFSFVFATCCIAFVGAVATFLPAWKAAKVDPMVALRYE